LEGLQRQKDEEVSELKRQFAQDIEDLKERIAVIKALLDRATKYKYVVGKEFRQTIKKDNFVKLNRRVDAFDFENRMHREELYHLLER
jgi:hypothetical protein